LRLKENEKAKEKKNSGRTGSSSKSTASAVENSQSSRSGTSRKTQATASVASNLASSSGGQQPQAASNADGPSCSSGAETIINELLAYFAFYRDRGNFTDLHKLIVRFYSPSEISTAKSTVTSLLEAHLSGCQYATNRRHTTTRPAHEAEAKDILGIFELLDNLQVLRLIQFAAVSMDRLPKYGPKEVNICAVVDRQLRIDKDLTELKEALSVNNDARLNMVGDRMMDAVNTRLNAVTDTFNGQLRQLESQPILLVLG
jgi:hypothetical protein